MTSKASDMDEAPRRENAAGAEVAEKRPHANSFTLPSISGAVNVYTQAQYSGIDSGAETRTTVQPVWRAPLNPPRPPYGRPDMGTVQPRTCCPALHLQGIGPYAISPCSTSVHTTPCPP
ncbi:hypothetical protein DDE01_13980 [Desulfovibrio desulfuricans]|nr:hypothetical protein DDE01_13980 [Desulfovibrio desulfuricans]